MVERELATLNKSAGEHKIRTRSGSDRHEVDALFKPQLPEFIAGRKTLMVEQILIPRHPQSDLQQLIMSELTPQNASSDKAVLQRKIGTPMRTKLILAFLSLPLATILTAGVRAQQSYTIKLPPSEQTGSDASTAPNKIAFISDIGGGQSLYVANPDHLDVEIFGKLHIEGVRIPLELLFSSDRKQVKFVGAKKYGKDPALWIANTDGSGARRLMDLSGVSWNPSSTSPSPTGDRVAFAVSEENHSKIYAMKSDGSDFHFVADGEEFSWSPDGRQLALTTYVPEKQARHVRVVNIDGTNLREISTGGRVMRSSWSPDGKRLAVIESRAETSSEPKSYVVVIALDGTQKQIVVENPILYLHLDLDWSPDGEFLSFLSEFEGNRGLYVWSTRDTSGKRLRFFTGVQAPFAWSPDCKRIAYGENIVSIVDLSTEKARILFHTSGFGWPVWLPDGNHLMVYNTLEFRRNPDRQDLDLYITPVEPRLIKRLTYEGMDVSDLSGTANGKVIAFVANTKVKGETSSSVVYTINSDGSNLRKLAVAKIQSGWFAWSADGSKIAFVKEMTNCKGCRPGNLQIQVANADGSGEQTIVNEPAWNFAPAWLPDGKSIVFLSDRGNTHGVFIINIKSKRKQFVADVSEWLPNHVRIDRTDRFVPIAWSPDATKFATSSTGGRPGWIRVVDIKKPSTTFESSGIAPSVLSWTPDSSRIAVWDMIHGMAMNSITPSYVDLVAVDGSSRVKLTPGFEDYAPRLFEMAWTSDGKRFAYNGIVICDADGSNRRWIIRGTRPAWVQ
jgi:Tol biopolymer transport system component